MDAVRVAMEDLMAGRAPGESLAHWQRVVQSRVQLLLRVGSRHG